MNIKLKTGGIYAFISSDETSSIVLKKMYNGDNSKNFNITCLNGKENVKYEQKSRQFVPDDIVCYSEMTVWQFIVGGLYCEKKQNRTNMLCLAENYLEMLNISKNTNLLELTFEQGHLMAMVTSLMREPEILLLEKPYDMLDLFAYDTVSDIFKKYAEKGNIVIASFDKFENVGFECDEYIFMEDGEIKFIFDKENIPGKKKLVILKNSGVYEFLNCVDGKYRIDKTESGYELLFDVSDIKYLREVISKVDYDDISIKDLSMNEFIFNYYDAEVESR